MSWNKKEDEQKDSKGRYEPSRKEMVDLYKELQNFKQKLIGNRLVSPFDQYLISMKTQSINEDGQFVVHDPEGHERLSKINAMMELLEYYKQEELYKEFPAEKKALADRVKALRDKMIS